MSKYIIVSPVRNEEEFIETTIQSVINQSVLPVEYIIVNDGSTDSTPQIIEKYVKEYPWIKQVNRPKGEHSPGGGVVAAFYSGFNIIENKDWEFVIKLDGDLKFESNYFEYQLEKFRENPRLGITSGKTYQPKGDRLVLDKMPDDHTRGPAKMYKRECWDEMGGLPKVLGWDTLDELQAQVLGWETRSYPDLKLIHYKPIGFKQKKIVPRELKAGERQHYLGYHPLFALSRGIYRMGQKPYVIAGLLNIYGFVKAEIKKSDQIKDERIINHLRKKQLERLTFKRKLVG
jgi:glycosyltransferase involved in cell wall biosynthesis